MKKKKYLKWWIAAVSAVFIVGAGIFVYTQYKAAQRGCETFSVNNVLEGLLW